MMCCKKGRGEQNNFLLCSPPQNLHTNFHCSLSSMSCALQCWVSLRLLLLLTIVATQHVPDVEMTALFAFHNSTCGDTWRWQTDDVVWNFTVDGAGHFAANPCSSSATATSETWQGVTCSQRPQLCSSQTCHITKIDLTSYGLSGSIPGDIRNLSHLEYLQLDYNQLTGPIPHEVFDLTSLTFLSVYVNELTGSIPAKIGQLQALTFLSLDSNSLTGIIPTEIVNLSKLVIMFLGDNSVGGSIPSGVEKLTSLVVFYIYNSQLTGTIPDEIGQLTALKTLFLYGNLLTGTIPGKLGQLTTLLQLQLHNNQLMGTIPSEIGQLTALGHLVLHSNQLRGSIPNELGQNVALERLHLYNNLLTGTIPSAMGDLTALEIFYLYSNQLTGTIPSEVGQLTALQELVMYSNQLTGDIPNELSQLAELQDLHLYDNLLTGTIPSEIGQLTALKLLTLRNNWLTGIIPDSMGLLTGLEVFYLRNNQLTGTIPVSVGYLVNVTEMLLDDNFFVGTLPVEMSNMRKLQSLFLQNNLLTGQLTNVFNHAIQLEMTNVDISNNLLSGSLPAELFLLSQLRVLSMSVNCFEGELPASVCSAKQVEVLSLNGLRAAEGCADSVVFPLSGVGLFNTVGGTVPACVWIMRNLSVLHLTGNGLSGELVHLLPVHSQIADLSLSHNQLSGTIPLDILNIASLDLSFNQLSGKYADSTQYQSDSSINLEVNRLSGQLPVSELERVSSGSLSVLHGNLFACNSIPQNDEYSYDYVCGSRNLNDSLFVFVSACGVTVVLVMLACWGHLASGKKLYQHRLVAALYSRCVLLWSYVRYLKHWDTHHVNHNNTYAPVMRKIALLSETFVGVMQNAVQLFVVVLMGSLALYLVKVLDSDAYATHSETYAWFWTLAYMRGVVPACMLLMLWAAAISACFYRIVVHPKLAAGAILGWPQALFWDSRRRTTTPTSRPSAATDNCWTHRFMAFIFNAVVTVTVNTAYIYSTQQGWGVSIHFCIQLSLSIFRLVYSVFVSPFLCRSVFNVIENIHFRFFLLMINNLLIPCVVTVLTSDACFQGLLIPAHAIATPYSYRTCAEFRTSQPEGVQYCSEYITIEVESAPLVPPFTYNNQCRSVVLTSYIPVFLLGYSIQLVLPFIILALLLYVPYDSMSPSVRKLFHGIIWPEYWRQGSTDVLPRVLLKIKSIFCNDIFNNWLLMITFGLCSPVLAVAIVCSVLLKMSLWVLLVGRFTRCTLLDDGGCDGDGGGSSSDANSSSVPPAATPSVAITTTSRTTVTAPLRPSESLFNSSSRSSGTCTENRKDAVYLALLALAEVYIPLFEVLARSFWRLVWCSAIFVALLSWDMVMDDVGWLRSVWVPLVPFGYVILLRCVSQLYNLPKDSKQDSAEKANVVRDDVSASGVSLSPLHVTDSL